MTSRRLLDPTARTLLDAAAYIESNGHNKNNYYGTHLTIGQQLPACAIGAIYAVTSAPDEPVNRLRRLVDDIPKWNDAKNRTPIQVVAALRKAALA